MQQYPTGGSGGLPFDEEATAVRAGRPWQLAQGDDDDEDEGEEAAEEEEEEEPHEADADFHESEGGQGRWGWLRVGWQEGC